MANDLGVEINEFKALSLFSKMHRYKNEAVLCDLIEKNISELISYILPDAEILSIERESHIKKYRTFKQRKGLPNSRVDFLVKTTKGLVIIEAKNPSSPYSELRNGVAQCMDYAMELKPAKTVLVTSVFSDVVTKMIKEYNLPIELVLVNRDNFALMVKNHD